MFNQQLDIDGRAHDIAPDHEVLKLFDSAPQIRGQIALDTDAPPVYIGHCRVGTCTHTTRSETTARGQCPEHGVYPLARLKATLSSTHVCNWECLAARGPRCECSCGGANHGAWSMR